MENKPPSQMFPAFSTINCRGKLINLENPVVMGILNVTPDSFSDGGKYNNRDAALEQAGKMLEQGAEIIDIGGYSSRPGAKDITEAEELDRLESIVPEILKHFPRAILSIDTFRSGVAKAMLEVGAHIINDISAGKLDERMMETVAGFDAPYILMHMQGTPRDMQQNPHYENVVEEVMASFVERACAAKAAGITDIIVDPGFGFGKTLAHNYELFRNLGRFNALGLPILIGISRKSMIYRSFGAEPTDVLELTTALHLQALQYGVKILRVHDVKPAIRAVQLHHYLTDGTL